jgi:CDP-diacylglycerol--serine O-phosphatidyltransferase
MPTPATGLLIASFALMDWDRPAGWAAYLQNRWVVYGIIALLCYLMVSRIHFFKLVPSRWGIAHSWPSLLLVAAALAAIPLFRFGAIPFAFALYIILSLVVPRAKEEPAAAQDHPLP